MKKLLFLFLLFPLNSHAQFNSKFDTIVIKTNKRQDTRGFIDNFLTLPESNIACYRRSLPTFKCFPDSLDSISIFINVIDKKQAFYQCYKNGLINDKAYLDTMLSHHDTIGCKSRFINTYVAVMTGIAKNGKVYYVPETNNNFNFCDEKAYELKKEYGFGDTTCIKHRIIYEKFRGNEVVIDSTYISVNRSLPRTRVTGEFIDKKNKLDYIAFKFYESRHGSFTFNNTPYKLAFKCFAGSYEAQSQLILYTDSLNFSLPLYGNKIGSYITLNNTSYRFAKVLYNGEKVILVKGEMPTLDKKPLTTIRSGNL